MEISTVILDCDGCLTDNMVAYPDRSRQFNVLDGHGFQLLAEAGITCYIFSGEGDTSIHSRAHKLGVDLYITKDKLQTALDLDLDLNKVAFMGNDIMDLDLLKEVAYPACPHDAWHSVLEYCYAEGFVSSRDGGQGAFRELAQRVLAISGVSNGD